MMAKLLWASISILFVASTPLKAQASLDMNELGRLTYNETLNDVWGWVDTANSKEYALVGVQNGLSIVDVTNPASPVQTNFFPGANSIWRDMKTYGNYSYTVHDVFSGTSNGIFIVDMTTIGNSFPTTYTRKPTISVNGTSFNFNRAHNIYIDEAAGHLYVFGSNVGIGGALIFDIATDPTNPSLLGVFDDYYLHDGVGRGDTLWGAAVNNGIFLPIDISTPGTPTVMATKNTPFNFTHNIWFSDDNNRVFTTDEKTSAFIAEYDVSDLNNISELDRIRTSFGTNVIPHNVHFFNNFLVNSYYTSGVQILDVSQPGLMIETGYFDTSLDSGDGFSGCWGAYPYLPSGNILATDRQRGLYVLGSDYTRGCYLNVNVIDSITGQNIINASVQIPNSDMGGNTNIFGNYRAGQAASGSYQMIISKSAYRTDTVNLTMSHGQASNLQIALLPESFDLEAYGPLLNVEPYPNPLSKSSTELRFSNWDASLDGSQYSIFEINGRQIGSGELREANIDLQELRLEAGTYILRLQADNFVRTYPVILQ